MSDFILYWTFLAALNPQHQEVFEKTSRVQRIQDTLVGLTTTDSVVLNNTFNYLQIMERNACQSEALSLKISCLIAAAQKNCDDRKNKKNRPACLLYSDVIVANKLGESRFIPDKEKFRILKKTSKNQNGFLDALNQKYGVLATEFMLGPAEICQYNDFSCLALAIDDFCITTSNRKNLGWQHCSSALVWFLGTARQQ